MRRSGRDRDARGSRWRRPRTRCSPECPRATLIVTDVAGVKSAIVAEVADPRFLAGHPMAGSELRGLAGARADLFRGCTWVLTPTSATKPETYTALHGVLRELGANVVAVGAEDHDRLVAVASHVPHLLAGASDE